MLQRAASNTYSWWWASHIRTKQSKWLEQCLQDMEEKVKRILRLIDHDGDSFAKRAEMYYKRRPEIISSVEEAFKSFRALADRYDLLSKEFQNANHTIATVFPEQVQFGMGEDEDFLFPKDSQNTPNPSGGKPSHFTPNIAVAPNIPDTPPANAEWKPSMISAPKKLKSKKSFESENEQKSCQTNEEALDEIKRLQKEILALQTVKEFVKSSYESGVEKYWGIENQIMDKQQRALELQDEFNVGATIEDNDARTLMAEAALKSCVDTLTTLQEKQDKLIAEARQEYTRIEAACDQVKTLRDKYVNDEDRPIRHGEKIGGEGEALGKDVAQLILDTMGVQKEKLAPEEDTDLGTNTVATMTVSQMAEKVDQLVNKVINLETAVSTQNALVDRLKKETDDLHAQIRTLEDEKGSLLDDRNSLRAELKEMEQRLSSLQELNRNVESQHNNMQMDFAEAHSNLDNLSEKLNSVKLEEEQEETTVEKFREIHTDINLVRATETVEENKNSSRAEGEKSFDAASETTGAGGVKEVDLLNAEGSGAAEPELEPQPEQELKPNPVKRETKRAVSLPAEILEGVDDTEAQKSAAKSKDMSWQEILLSGVEDREAILLKEYTTILRNYKDLKRKLHQMEKKEKDIQFDETLRMRELRKAILKRDHEIRCLRQRLQGSQTGDAKDDVPSVLDTDGKASVDNAEDDIQEHEIKSMVSEKIPSLTKIEGKLRADIDAILEENWGLWLQFSTAYNPVQKFKTEVEDLQNEAQKLKERRKPDGSSSSNLKSDVKAIRIHLKEIQSALSVWLNQSVSLKDELEKRSTSLYNIQEEITNALGEGAEEEEIQFGSLQFAKFQGEILSMKQENYNAREQLESCLDHVKILQLEIDKTIRQLNEDFGIGSEHPESSSWARIPLKAFLFGSKGKKKAHPSKILQETKSDGDVHMATQ